MYSSSSTSQSMGVVFNVQKFSVHDGPGIRTTVFLKGCPLRCHWCCNPESQRMAPEISRNMTQCQGTSLCGACHHNCPRGVCVPTAEATCQSTPQCTLCCTCIKACPVGCLSLVGKLVSAAEVIANVSADFAFYGSSGGLTLSGGEVLMQPDFALALCAEAHRHGLSVAMETCAQAPWEVVRRVCAEMDYLLVDIKHHDARRHREATGVDNVLILQNIQRLRTEFPQLPLTVRCPVVPGFNDDEESIAGVARFVGGLSEVSLELLEYHRLGEGKYNNLGRTYALHGVAAPMPQVIHKLRSVAAEFATVL